MKRLSFVILITFRTYVSAQQLFIGEDAFIHIAGGANLEVGGDLENAGEIQNLGMLSLYGDWTVNNRFNGNEGSISFLGGGSQTIAPTTLTLSELTIDVGGVVNFPGDEYIVTDRIDFQFGNIQIGEGTDFILGPNARVVGGSNDSYFDGTIIAEGNGAKLFPVGNNGVYAPLTLLNVDGFNPRIAARYTGENTRDPIPSDSILGVSHLGYWEFRAVQGIINRSTRIEVEFSEQDLTDFKIRNDIRHRVNSPILAYTNNLTEPWGSLGISSILDTDSLTFGTLTSGNSITPGIAKTFIAVGLAPRIPPEGVYFIPEAFSPNATDPDNQAFRVFGEKVAEEDFYLRIFNRLGVVVYETSSFEEANQNGWNGINLSGGEEPTGVYYYEVRLKFVTDRVVEKSGAFYLVK